MFCPKLSFPPIGRLMPDKSVETIERLEGPWLDGRATIHSLVLDALAKRGLAKEELRIELAPKYPGEINWAPGALDSLFGKQDTSDRQTKARRLVATISNVLRRPTVGNAAHLYGLLCESDTISVVDAVLSRVRDEIVDRRKALATLSRRLILESPDVEPVKAGVALLGVSGGANDAALISTMGNYEQITIYSVVALSNLLADAEQAIWNMARDVHGWGRVRAVNQLATTKNPEIKNWMLREGFRNTIMYEYLACICATAGELSVALRGNEIDTELLIATGEILSALIRGGPAEEIEDYIDGPAVCVSYLRHMATNPARDVRAVESVFDIKRICERERAERLRSRQGWNAQVFLEIRSLVNAVLQNATIKTIIEEGLSSEDSATFNIAASMASNFGIDSWPLRLTRQRVQALDQWYWLMQTEDPTRIEQVVGLARAQLNLDLIGSGPTTSLGMGLEFADDRALEFILQDLRRFPGIGWDLVRVGLRGRVARARNMAINALRDLGRDAWPSDAMEELRLAAEREPDKNIRQRMRDLIDGQLRR
jgi:hypothetical protein